MKLFTSAAMAALLACVGCSGDDQTTESKPDAVNNVDVGGDSFTPDSTKPDTASDTFEASVDSTIDSTLDSSVDSTPESSADTTDTTEAGLCPSGQWRDYEMGTCDACPETPFTLGCGSFTSAGSGWNSSTHTFTLAINVSLTQMVSASVTYVVVHSDGSSTPFTVDATVSGDSFSFVATVSAGDTTVYVSALTIVDACGTTSNPSIDASVGASSDAGLDTFHVGCPA